METMNREIAAGPLRVSKRTTAEDAMPTRQQQQWPRVAYNYPIILCAIGIQYVWAFSLMLDASVVNTTVTAALLPYLHLHNGPFNAHDLDFNYIRWALIFILLATATLSFIAFQFTKKIYTVLAL